LREIKLYRRKADFCKFLQHGCNENNEGKGKEKSLYFLVKISLKVMIAVFTKELSVAEFFVTVFMMLKEPQ